MQVNQILIRPGDEEYVVQYSDAAGRANNLTVSSAGNANVAAIITEATSRVPTEANHPDKEEIQHQIAELELRLRALKQSIGMPS